MTTPTVQLDTGKRGYTVREAAQYCGVSIDLLNQLRSQGSLNGITGPKFLKIGKKVIYPIESLNTWLDSFAQAHSLAALSIAKED